ncbi:MAG: hypothetical protein Q8K32_25255 [Archangium sp.]|nr:hypothetical protein [Archangium sp.]
MTQTPEELQLALAASARRAAELQAWIDSSELEADQLRARIAELEAKPAPNTPDPRVAELQAWVDASEVEADQLRARITELETKPTAVDPRVAELQAWVDCAEEETDQLRARIAELEAKPATSAPDPRVAELQAWVDSSDEEAGHLRARVAELEAQAPDRRVAELQAWIDANEADAEELTKRATRAEAELSALKATVLTGDSRALVERISELEAVNHSLRGLNTGLVQQVSSAGQRDVALLTAQLEAARAQGSESRVAELQHALSSAREALAALEVQHETTIVEARSHLKDEAREARLAMDKQRAALVAREREVAALTAQLATRTDEAAVLEARVKAHTASEQKLEAEVAEQRDRACQAEQSLGAAQSEVTALRHRSGVLEAKTGELTGRLEESQRWLAQGELEAAELTRELTAARTERAQLASAAPAEPSAPLRIVPPPPPADADAPEDDGLEGFSPQRMHRLEALLAAEKVKTGLLQQFAATSEAALSRMKDELEAAGGRLADLRKRLGLSDTETDETLERLEAARRELRGLFAELAALQQGAPDDELIAPEDVLDAPLAALDQLAAQQAEVAQEATRALAGEQRAREQLMGDLTWLKAELEKLSNVREDLRHRIHAMVQRELKRKQVVSALLDKLRSTEVSSASRAGTLRRLHAAMELAQKTAVRVQTVYFQKQIGSLNRQLEKRTPSPFGRGSG